MEGGIPVLVFVRRVSILTDRNPTKISFKKKLIMVCNWHVQRVALGLTTVELRT